MRSLLVQILISLVFVTPMSAVNADSDDTEVIVIEGWPPVPKVQAKPQKRYLPRGPILDDIFLRIAPAYSKTAIQRDTWTMAWLLLDIDDRGVVRRVKFLKYPGHDLEAIAVHTALSLEFKPALDQKNRPTNSYLAFPIEWPTYSWLLMKTGMATGIPNTLGVPCRGKAPLNLNSARPTYRDCSSPDWSKASSEPWLDRRYLSRAQ